MVEEKSESSLEKPVYIKRGPLGLGDPDDTRLRKAEANIVIPKLILKDAEQKCAEPFKVFLDCAKNAGLFVVFKCKQEMNAKNDCVSQWTKNPEFIKDVTDNYINARSYYRRTGQCLTKYKHSIKRN